MAKADYKQSNKSLRLAIGELVKRSSRRNTPEQNQMRSLRKKTDMYSTPWAAADNMT